MGAIRAKQTKSGVSYEARINRAGIPAISKSFETKEQARVWINNIESKIDKGQKVSKKVESVEFADACDDFLAHYKPRKGSITYNDQQLVNRVKFDLAGYRVNQITNDVLQKFIDLMLKTEVPKPANRKKIHPYYNGDKKRFFSASTVRKHYFAIKKVLEWHAPREKYYLDENLFKGIQVPESWQGARERRLNEGELDKLIASASKGYEHKEIWPLLIRFAIATSARQQEIIKAEWKEFNLKLRHWIVPADHVKTDEDRQIPLSLKAMAILEEMEKYRKPGETRVFHQWSSPNVVSKGFKRLAMRAGINDLTFHDIRHEAISLIFEKTDLNVIKIMSITGHKNASTLQGYAHLRASELAHKLDSI